MLLKNRQCAQDNRADAGVLCARLLGFESAYGHLVAIDHVFHVSRVKLRAVHGVELAHLLFGRAKLVRQRDVGDRDWRAPFALVTDEENRISS
jgi:hypothetical protein